MPGRLPRRAVAAASGATSSGAGRTRRRTRLRPPSRRSCAGTTRAPSGRARVGRKRAGATHPRRSPPRRRLRRVLGVDPHVLVAQVRTPRRALARPRPHAHGDVHGAAGVPLLLEVGAGGGLVEGQGLPALHQHVVVAQPDVELAGVERHPGVARRARDAAPVGVAAEDGRLDEGGADHALGHLLGVGVGPGALHVALEQHCRALAVPRDGLGQARAQRSERPFKRRRLGRRLVGDGRVARRAARQGDDGVVRARVAVHADLVEGGERGPLDHGAPHARRNRSVARHHAEHGGHVGVNHAGALGHAPDAHLDAAHVRL
mmetsp:Transcript_14189/g.48911  ORF Transcript_14189/g.48911 Transcript_14189/m.48911 type:complete len:318 (-) Transcript_14189:552-1505(-)